MSFIGDSPNVKRLKLEPLSADPSNPEDGDIQYSDGTARTEGFWGYNNGTWIALDAGVAGLTDIQDTFTAGFQPFVDKGTKIAVPDTEIENRAFITDDSATGKSLSGSEYISTAEFAPINGEYGPSNENVFGCKDERVRFVGNGWAINDNSAGRRAQTGTASDFAEITFYGTGVSMITSPHGGSSRDFRVTVDGGVEGSNIYPTQSSILEGRNYSPGPELELTSGETVGQHTVKVRYVSGGNMRIVGFKVYNDRTDRRLTPATTYAGGIKAVRATNTDTAIKPSGVSGSKGARVVTYQTSAGAIAQAITEAETSQSDLGAADHSGEELLYRKAWYDFGRDGSEDFSDRKGSGSLFSAAYTMPDNGTQLIGSGVVGNTGTSGLGLRMNAINNTITFTFRGTGLDVFIDCAATVDTVDIAIDGVSIGNMLTTVNTQRMSKVVSGLSTGSHTAVFTATTNLGTGPGFLDFLVYDIPEPAIPDGATKLDDEIILADYVENSDTTATPTGRISQGVVRHLNMRELLYTGTWITPNLSPSSYESGYDVRWNGSGATARIHFEGTGFEVMMGRADNTPNITFTVDGSADLSSFTTGLIYGGSGLTFTDTTGIVSGNGDTSGIWRLSVQGLTEGHHDLTITVNNGNSQNIELIDITQGSIQVQKSPNQYPSAAEDARNFDALKKDEDITGPDFGAAKAWVVFDGSSNLILKSFNIAAVVDEGTGLFGIYFEKPFKDERYAFSAGGDLTAGKLQTSSQVFRDHINMEFENNSGTNTDPGYMSVVFFGELQDEETE